MKVKKVTLCLIYDSNYARACSQSYICIWSIQLVSCNSFLQGLHLLGSSFACCECKSIICFLWHEVNNKSLTIQLFILIPHKSCVLHGFLMRFHKFFIISYNFLFSFVNCLPLVVFVHFMYTLNNKYSRIIAIYTEYQNLIFSCNRFSYYYNEVTKL
jgi:hypothetical protein